MSKKAKRQLETVLFSLPAIILVCLMMYLPFVLSGYYSLTEWNGISKEAEFIGLQNFKTIFVESSDFRESLWFTTRYTFFFVIFLMSLPWHWQWFSQRNSRRQTFSGAFSLFPIL